MLTGVTKCLQDKHTGKKKNVREAQGKEMLLHENTYTIAICSNITLSILKQSQWAVQWIHPHGGFIQERCYIVSVS